MIEIVSGHLGSGQWRFKTVNNVVVLAHVQAFNRHDEFRIGPDQVSSYQIEQTTDKTHTVKIHFTEERYCRALIPKDDLNQLDIMVNDGQRAPDFERHNQLWIKGLIALFIAFAIIEFIK